MSENFQNIPPEPTRIIEKPEKDFNRYCERLMLDSGQLQGKTILDVGSGPGRFGEYVEQHYPDTKVLRFDARQEPGIKVDFVARADQLPLVEKSIDLALAHASISNNPGKYVVAALEEIFSTIKDGGEIRVAPLFDAPYKFSQERLRLVREYITGLENQGLATAEWKVMKTIERTTPKGGTVHEDWYLLIIRKALGEMEGLTKVALEE